MKGLLSEAELIWSPIVANNRMNRKRVATGVNSYEKDLRFNPSAYLDEQLLAQSNVSWLDLCCGEGNALLQYAQSIADKSLQDKVNLVGIDLVDAFQSVPPSIHCVKFRTGSLVDMSYTTQFDLITCVHGLHYIGDKLSVLATLLKALQPHGIFIANLDLNNIKLHGDANHQFIKQLFKINRISYNSRTKIVQCEGPRDLHLPITYLGADDQAGPNYSGQEAVDSFYSSF
ncbi:methyltransferase family protein [Chitinophaga dinghuensis]|uniref:Methyltransferase family protein n=1 Tax=Chitinophaga dinghuensis TaxID=1539050 RepID=A0A327WI48_9BACT|nr:class I SAM-dependent methyltransferase [Chitinophaga dinghuensis]RAJ87424.1 methyltransferase family protein [Chitinophaga dinghuensis]